MATLLTRRMLLRCALGAVALPFDPAMSASAKVTGAESRIALVIGNGAYRAAPLKNPPGDANAVTAALRGLVGQADLVDCLFLVRNGVSLDVAFSLDAGERTAWVIVIGQMDGLTWDWEAMAWVTPG